MVEFNLSKWNFRFQSTLYWIIYGTYRDYFKTTLYKSFCWQHFGGIPACINPFWDVGEASETAIE